MKYGLQVNVATDGGKFDWRDVRPSNGEPYRYAERAEAESMARMCYDGDPDIVRVVECPEGSVTGRMPSDPNLQGIPTHVEEVDKIRKALLSDEPGSSV